jgi:hypothetical protein
MVTPDAIFEEVAHDTAQRTRQRDEEECHLDQLLTPSQAVATPLRTARKAVRMAPGTDTCQIEPRET